MKKPTTGGAMLLKTKGKKYFSELAKKRWAKEKKEVKVKKK